MRMEGRSQDRPSGAYRSSFRGDVHGYRRLMDLGKLLREARRRGRINLNVSHKTNIKVARNIAKGNSTSMASAEQDAEINQSGDRRRSDGRPDG